MIHPITESCQSLVIFAAQSTMLFVFPLESPYCAILGDSPVTLQAVQKREVQFINSFYTVYLFASFRTKGRLDKQLLNNRIVDDNIFERREIIYSGTAYFCYAFVVSFLC